MSQAEICKLSHESLKSIKALKQSLDSAFERLIASGSKEDLQIVESLKQQIETELRTPLIASNVEQISNKTRIYLGKLEPGMFHKLPKSIEHIYTSFPDGELRLESLQIGGKTSKELQELTGKNQVTINFQAKDMLDASEFVTSKQPERIDLIRLTVEDLGSGERLTVQEIYARALELGLELCPPTVGPEYRLAHLDQPVDDWVAVGMKPISGKDGYPCVFTVVRHSVGPCLNAYGAKSDDEWDLDDQLLFRVRRDA